MFNYMFKEHNKSRCPSVIPELRPCDGQISLTRDCYYHEYGTTQSQSKRVFYLLFQFKSPTCTKDSGNKEILAVEKLDRILHGYF